MLRERVGPAPPTGGTGGAGGGTRAPTARPRRRVISYWRQYLAVSPFFVIFGVFFLGPVLFSLYLSFQSWDGLSPMRFVGLREYRFLWHDPVFWLAVRNTFAIWILATVPMLFLALVLAVMLNSTKRLVGFYRIAVFIPNVTSLVAVAIFFFAVFNEFGLANAILHWLGQSSTPWLSDPWLIKVVIAALMTWQWTGYNAIIYLAGLQAIPTELYEAARIDGAGPVQTFFRITIPLLRPIILFTVVVSTINGMQSFAEPQVLFGSNASRNPDSGGPGQAGLTMILYFYRQAFDNHDYGYGAAIAWSAFLIILVFMLINWRLIARRED